MEPRDVEEIETLHGRMGFDYRFPNLASPLFLAKNVVTDDSGGILAAGVLKVQAEAYLWIDPSSPTRIRGEAIENLAERMLRAAYDSGVDQVVCWVPVSIEKEFGKELGRLKFSRDREGFHTWTREL